MISKKKKLTLKDYKDALKVLNTRKLGNAMGDYFDGQIIKYFSNDLPSFTKPLYYRKKKVIVWKTIKWPVFSVLYDDDYEFGTGEKLGYKIEFIDKKLFPIGWKYEKEPVYRKKKYPQTGQTIKFRRYGELKVSKKGEKI